MAIHILEKNKAEEDFRSREIFRIITNHTSVIIEKSNKKISNLPEFGSNLVAALPGLQVNNLSHGEELTGTNQTLVDDKLIVLIALWWIPSLIYWLRNRYHGSR